MNAVFLDTAGLVAVANTNDQWHERAELIWQDVVSSGRPFVTSSLVLVELADGLARLHYRELAIKLVDSLINSSRVEVVRPDKDVEARAWQLFRERPDKEWGMTDCISMTIMQDRGILDVFTLDRHFLQGGFNAMIDSI